jgi:hypothetical protein
MIPIKTDPLTRGRYVENVVRAWFSASADQERRGRAWYPAAHDLAMAIGPDVRTGAGVIAALSANKRWEENVRLARQACAGTPGGHVADAVGKASRILAGADPATVLPMDRKTGMFYRCILDPSDPDAVVIDRHAHDVAVGEIYGDRDRGLRAAGRYALLAHCYREAAMRVGELPSTVQAVTWVAQTDALSGVGTRTSKVMA